MCMYIYQVYVCPLPFSFQGRPWALQLAFPTLNPILRRNLLSRIGLYPVDRACNLSRRSCHRASNGEFIFCCCLLLLLFHFVTNIANLAVRVVADKQVAVVSCCYCLAYRRYHNLLASTLLYNTLSRTSVDCIVCYTRFEPRVHNHHPRRGSLTAGYRGLCLLSYRLLFVGPSTVHTGSGAPVEALLNAQRNVVTILFVFDRSS